MPAAPDNAVLDLRLQGSSLHAILKAWDAAKDGEASLSDLNRAALTLHALGKLSVTPSSEMLTRAFGLPVDAESFAYDDLMKPVPAHTEPEDDDDPEDRFDDLVNACACCGKPATEKQPLSTCQRCKKIRYCGRPCQLKAWRAGHKESCGSKLPTPSAVGAGDSSYAARVLREFGSADLSIAKAAIERLMTAALSTDATAADLKLMCDAGGVEAVVSAMDQYAKDDLELRMRGYVLLSACCQVSKEGAQAAVKGNAAASIIGVFQHLLEDSSDDADARAFKLRTGVAALGRMADTGITGKEAVVDAMGPYWIVLIMRENQQALELQMDAIRTLGAIAYRGGIKCRKAVVWNSAVDGVITVMRAFITAEGVNPQLAEIGVTSLRYFIAGDESNLICGSAAELAHMMTKSMAEHLGVEAVIDAMMWHQTLEAVQENGSAVLANVCSVDLGAKRQAELLAHSAASDTQTTRNLVDALTPVVRAIRRFPNAPSPMHALQVLTANLGSTKEAIEAGADITWLPLALQFDKDQEEKL